MSHARTQRRPPRSLLSLAQSKGEDYQRVLGRYTIERFLYRLGRSPYRDKFALKGATLFTLWTRHTHRSTTDLDILGQGSSAISDVQQTIKGICEIQEEDGLVFDSASVEGTKIKEDGVYGPDSQHGAESHHAPRAD